MAGIYEDDMDEIYESIPSSPPPRQSSRSKSLSRGYYSMETLYTYVNTGTRPKKRAGNVKTHGIPCVYSAKSGSTLSLASLDTPSHCTRISSKREYCNTGANRTLPRVPSEYNFTSGLPVQRNRHRSNCYRSIKTAQTEKTGDKMTGMFIQDALYSPTGDWPNDVHQLLVDYNKYRTIEEMHDLEKHIARNILPHLRTEKNDISEMAVLLNIDNQDISNAVISVLIEESLEMIPKNVDCIYKTLYILMSVISRSPQQIMLIMFNFVGLISLPENVRKNESCKKKDFCKKCIEVCKSNAGKTKGKLSTSDEQTCHLLLKTFMQQFKSSKTERTDVVFDKMDGSSFFDQYVYLFGVINKVFTTSSCKEVELLNATVKLIVNQKPKPRSQESNIEKTLLTLVTTSSVLLLQNDAYLDLQPGELIGGLLEVLNAIFNNSNVLQEIRFSLLQIAEPLFLSKNVKIVESVLFLHLKNHQSSVQLSRLVGEYIAKGLVYTGIILLNFSCPNEQTPAWQTFDGLVTYDNKELVIHCLMPSLRSLTTGKMADYTAVSNTRETNRHLNNLNILRHLQEESTHLSLIQLMAYQISPLPIFYITEKVTSLTLNEYLLRRRQSNCYQPKSLTAQALEVVSAVIFIHEKGVVHTDLTSHSFRICDGGQRIVLYDLTNAKILSEDKTMTAELDNQDIPTLWSAPESILADEFSVKSDTWMVGLILYEIYTHGCQPYTEMYSFDIEKILSYIVFHDLPPKRWPCIPREIYDLILSSAQRKPSDRICLMEVHRRLEEFIDCKSPDQKQRSLSMLSEDDKMYPNLDPKKRYIQRGIPKLFMDMKRQCINNSDAKYAYMNLQAKQRSSNKKLQVQITELTSPDRPSMTRKGDGIQVEEQVTALAIDCIRAHLDIDTCSQILHMPGPPTWTKSDQPNDFSYSLKYELKCTNSLTEIARSRYFGDPTDQHGAVKYVEIALNMVKFVQEMHEKSWVLGSVRAADMFIANNSSDDYQIVMARLGRMLWFDRLGLDDDSVISPYGCTDYTRWCPIEVLQYRQYSFASDVYSVAMAIYEFFMTLNGIQNDPLTEESECAPFMDVSLDELPCHLYSNGKPPRPSTCPEWLYDLLTKCWHRDKDKRLRCQELYEEILKQFRSMSNDEPNESSLDQVKDLSDHYDIPEEQEYSPYQIIQFKCVNSDSDSEETEPIPYQRMQKRTRHYNIKL